MGGGGRIKAEKQGRESDSKKEPEKKRIRETERGQKAEGTLESVHAGSNKRCSVKSQEEQLAHFPSPLPLGWRSDRKETCHRSTRPVIPLVP